ncbi:hypothetical protein DPMN_103728 [Dreissena polymorpha]|uniref:Uncharacterized protein n=1 Tax=Dreissena polymorpha TaxID=45954 RepID=A0A9D4H6I6_DREPO|nr:hypothetical protein DPMN_103728 [Dreissena polymorpha]
MQKVAGWACYLAHKLHQPARVHGRGCLKVKPLTAQLKCKQWVKGRRRLTWPWLQ